MQDDTISQKKTVFLDEHSFLACIILNHDKQWRQNKSDTARTMYAMEADLNNSRVHVYINEPFTPFHPVYQPKLLTLQKNNRMSVKLKYTKIIKLKKCGRSK